MVETTVLEGNPERKKEKFIGSDFTPQGMTEQQARNYAFNHRHEPYQQVAEALGITPRALQHRYESWGFSPKTPCAGYVTARQYSRFFNIPYPTVVDRLTHENLEGRKHGIIWEVPVDKKTRSAILAQERRTELKRSQSDRRLKDRYQMARGFEWSAQALELLRSFDRTKDLEDLQKELESIGEIRTIEAIKKKIRKEKGAQEPRWTEQALDIIKNAVPPGDFNLLKEQLAEIGENRTVESIRHKYARINPHARRRRKWSQKALAIVENYAGKVHIDQISGMLAKIGEERGRSAIQHKYQELDVSPRTNDGKLTAGAVARESHYNPSTIKKYLREGKLKGRNIRGTLWRVEWDQTQLQPTWTADRLHRSDPKVLEFQGKGLCVNCEGLLNPGAGIFCSRVCRMEYKTILYEEHLPDSSSLTRFFPPHFRPKYQLWLMQEFGVLHQTDKPQIGLVTTGLDLSAQEDMFKIILEEYPDLLVHQDIFYQFAGLSPDDVSAAAVSLTNRARNGHYIRQFPELKAYSLNVDQVDITEEQMLLLRILYQKKGTTQLNYAHLIKNYVHFRPSSSTEEVYTVLDEVRSFLSGSAWSIEDVKSRQMGGRGLSLQKR